MKPINLVQPAKPLDTRLTVTSPAPPPCAGRRRRSVIPPAFGRFSVIHARRIPVEGAAACPATLPLQFLAPCIASALASETNTQAFLGVFPDASCALRRALDVISGGEWAIAIANEA